MENMRDIYVLQQTDDNDFATGALALTVTFGEAPADMFFTLFTDQCSRQDVCSALRDLALAIEHNVQHTWQ